MSDSTIVQQELLSVAFKSFGMVPSSGISASVSLMFNGLDSTILDDVEALLAAIDGIQSLPDRIERLTELLLGRPYTSHPLIGTADLEEQMVTRIDAFDCMTFAETVLALGWSNCVADVPGLLAKIRYHHGRVGWSYRNHYMSEWVQRNAHAGHVEPVLPQSWVWADPPRLLSVLLDYPHLAWRPRFFPSTAIDLLALHAAAGDVVGFVSNRPDLDTFHVGILIPGRTLAVRHATRSSGMVMHQDLAEFLRLNNVPGMLIVRPVPGLRP